MTDTPIGNTDPERLTGAKPVQAGGEGGPGQQPKGDFADYMKSNPSEQPTNASNAPSPVELQKPSQATSSPPSMQTIQGQINTSSSSLSDLKDKLHTRGLKLKHSEKQATRDKLGEANESLRSANKNLGADPGSPVNLHASKNPIGKYLALVADGQNQLASATKMISEVGKHKGSVNPAKMLLVQVKLAKAQQAIDYTSVLLGKAVEFLKTTMQTQI